MSSLLNENKSKHQEDEALLKDDASIRMAVEAKELEVIDNALSDLLKEHNVYENLYEVLHSNDIDVETIMNDLKLSDVDQMSLEFELNIRQKLSLRKLLRGIADTKTKSEEKYEILDGISINKSMTKGFIEEADEVDFKVIVAIDFGTHGTGLGYAILNDADEKEPQIYVEQDWCQNVDGKVRTDILLTHDAKFIAFGDDALKKLNSDQYFHAITSD